MNDFLSRMLGLTVCMSTKRLSSRLLDFSSSCLLVFLTSCLLVFSSSLKRGNLFFFGY